MTKALDRTSHTTTSLLKFVTLKRGYDLPSQERQDGDVPILGSFGITGSHSAAKHPGPGVSIGRSGASIGVATYTDRPYWPLNTTLYVTDFRGNDPRFVYYVLDSIDFRSFNSGGAVPSLNRNYLGAIRVPDLALPTQHKIAAVLSAYDDLIENNNRRITILEEMAQRIYREWFVEFRYPGHERVPLVDSELGPIPEGWAVVAFTDLAEILSGGTPRTSTAEYWGGDIPFFTPRDAPRGLIATRTDKHLTLAGLDRCNSQLYLPGTVFITARGTVGKVAMAGVPMAMNQSCYAVRGRDGVNQAFILFALLSQVDYLRTNTGGATFDTVVVDTFRRMRSVAPPHRLIADFADLANPILEMTKNLDRAVQSARSARDLLLPRLVSGEVDVTDLDIAMPEAA